MKSSPTVVQWQGWTNIAGGNWSDGTNWAGGASPAAGGGADCLLVFNTNLYSGSSMNNLGGTFQLNRLIFSGSLPAVTLVGNALSFTNHALTLPLVIQSGANAHTVSNPVALAASTTLGGSGAGKITLAGVVSGSGSLIKTNPGALTLGLANTYRGGTTVSVGTLTLQNRFGFGSGAVTLAGGTKAPEQLLAEVYQELRKLAAHRMAAEAPGHTLQATALVHEAWLRMGGENIEHFQSRAHFFAAVGEAMRRILVENARRKSRLKRGGDQQRVDLEAIELPAPMPDEQLLALDEALTRLSGTDARAAEMVNLHYFVGLTQEQMAKLFRAFTQADDSTSRRYGGTGLGLPITRSFVEMHKGRIWAESEVGLGSTFTFTLPREQAEPEPAISLPIDLEARGEGKRLIMCVHDDPGVITLGAKVREVGASNG